MAAIDTKFAHFAPLRQHLPVSYHDFDALDANLPPSIQDRLTYHVLAHRADLHGKRVWDIGCGDGVLTQAIYQMQPSRLLATDVRTETLDHLHAVFDECGFDTVHFSHCDVYDQNTMTQLAGQTDTIHMGGLFFHVNNHFQLLHTLCSGSANCVIFDTVVDKSSWTQSRCQVEWHLEDSDHVMFGRDRRTQHKGQSWIGHPNLAWITQTVEILDWCIADIKYHHYIHRTKRLQRKCIFTLRRYDD